MILPRRAGAAERAGGSTDEIVDLARALIEVDTANPPGSERAAAEVAAAYLERRGVEATIQPFDGDRANLVARIPGRGERPGLVFSGHLDTVPAGEGWSHPPRCGHVADGLLYGRGSADMKGSVAAMIVMLCALRDSGRTPAGDVVLALSAGEEIDSCGARMLAESRLLEGAGMLVVCESTQFEIGIAHRGALWLEVAATGERGHSSAPSRETNAICRLFDWLHPLDELEALVTDITDPLLGTGSLSLNMVSGGDAVNVVPERATARLDLRTVPGHRHDEILAALRARREDVSVSLLRDAPPLAVAEDSTLARAAAEAVTAVTGRPATTRGLPYMTDASVYVDVLGIPAVVVGPGSAAQAHIIDEFVEVRALGQAADVYQSIAHQLAYAS